MVYTLCKYPDETEVVFSDILKKVNGEVKETFDHISYYSRNSAKPDVEFIEAKEEYREIKNKIDKTSFKVLFVLQGQLTDTKLIFGPYNKERSHNDNMNEYINILKDSDYFHLINIIMRDFINEDKASDIIKLNNIKFNKSVI